MTTLINRVLGRAEVEFQTFTLENLTYVIPLGSKYANFQQKNLIGHKLWKLSKFGQTSKFGPMRFIVEN